MVAIIAKRDAEALSQRGWDEWLEAECLFDIELEAQLRSTPEALAEVEAWLCGDIEALPKKEGRAA